MKLLSTATLAASLFSFVAADVSKVELHQRTLQGAFSVKSSNAFRRELISEECLNKQEELEMTGINTLQIDDDSIFGICDFSATLIECDYDSLDLVDSGACSSAGGRVIKFDADQDCEVGLSVNLMNVPQCVHTACDVEEYADFLEKSSDFLQGDDEDPFGCEVDISVSGPTPTPAPTPAPTQGPLLISQECLNKQEELDLLGLVQIVQNFDDGDHCEFSFSDSSVTRKCDYDSLEIDSAPCSSAGGRVVIIDYEVSCEGQIEHYHNMPICLHTSCADAKEYASFVEDSINDQYDFAVDDIAKTCEFDISVSGAGNGGSATTSIITSVLALVLSLFVMLW